MMESKEDIDRYFKDRLEDYTENPAPDTWDKIADQLGHDRKRNGIVFIWRIAAGLALLISLSIMLRNSQKPQDNKLAEKNTVKVDSAKGTISTGIITQPQGVLTKKENSNHKLSTRIPVESRKEVVAGNVKNTQKNRIVENKKIAANPDVEAMDGKYAHPVDNMNLLEPIACYSIENETQSVPPSILFSEKSTKQVASSLTLDQLLAMNQEEPLEKEHKNSWLIGGQFAPQYSYRNYVSDRYPDYVVDQINAKEAPVITYSGGINISVSPAKRLSIQSGIYYSKFGLEQKDLAQVALNNRFDNTPPGSDNTAADETSFLVYYGNSTGKLTVNQVDNSAQDKSLTNAYAYAIQTSSENNIINNSKPVISAEEYYEYLEVPVNLKYKVIDRKIDFSLIGGLSTNFLVSTGINLKNSDNTSNNLSRATSDLTRINYAGSVGFGIEYPLFEKFHVTIEPKFKYYLNSIDKEANSNVHPYAVGIFTGISYVF